MKIICNKDAIIDRLIIKIGQKYHLSNLFCLLLILLRQKLFMFGNWFIWRNCLLFCWLHRFAFDRV